MVNIATVAVTWEIFKFKQFSKADSTVKAMSKAEDSSSDNSSSKKNNKACTHVRLILIGFGIVRRSSEVAQIPMQTQHTQIHTCKEYRLLETEYAITRTVAPSVFCGSEWQTG